jgi:hypothetical protein
VRVIAEGFFDGAPHRRELAEVYNRYLRCSCDPLYRPETSRCSALLQPLFVTSFLIDDFLADNASSARRRCWSRAPRARPRTASASAWRAGAASPARPRVVGLTSARNLAFTRALGCYDDVVAYDESRRCRRRSSGLRRHERRRARARRVHERWSDRLAYSCSVGGTHWQALGGGKGLAGPRPVLFFAPAQIKKRVAEWRRDRPAGAAARRHGGASSPASAMPRRRGCAWSPAAGARRCSRIRGLLTDASRCGRRVLAL